MKHEQRQPERRTTRILAGKGNPDGLESVAFARRRDKRRRQRDLAKQARKKNRR